MKIKVTQEHIANGNREVGNAFDCAVANAVREQTGYRTAVAGGTVFIYLQKREFPTRINVGKELSGFVYKYDHNYPVKPFEFELPLEEYVA